MAVWDFTTLCTQSPLPLCPLVGPQSALTGTVGINTPCYARSVQLANTIIFEAANDFMHMIALIMTVIMIVHIRSKFTAVGRKEITLFFYLYMALTVFSLVLDAGVVYPSMGIYPYLVAGQSGLTSAMCTSLLINGFVGFQLYEDGTRQSIWMLRGLSALMFLISGMVSILTFNAEAGLGPTHTLGLFVVLYVMNGISLAVYAVMQLLLVLNTLQDRWPLVDIVFGVLFFVAGQMALYVFGQQICSGMKHYLDGVFFATCCNLLAVMMVYKYWDSITREDLEFSVGTKQGQWEVKSLERDDGDDRATTTITAPTTTTQFRDEKRASLPPKPQPQAYPRSSSQSQPRSRSHSQSLVQSHPQQQHSPQRSQVQGQTQHSPQRSQVQVQRHSQTQQQQPTPPPPPRHGHRQQSSSTSNHRSSRTKSAAYSGGHGQGYPSGFGYEERSR